MTWWAPSPPCWRKVKVFVGLGGNFAMATPDTPLTFKALQSCELTVHIATKLNRSHLIHGREALILPTLGRTEIDRKRRAARRDGGGFDEHGAHLVWHEQAGLAGPAVGNRHRRAHGRGHAGQRTA
jgi:anaerobic selenocysteine-containing dehydrogenase